MTGGKLGGHKGGQWRFPGERQGLPKGFEEGAEDSGAGGRNPALGGGQIKGLEQVLDPLPKVHGLAVGDEVGASVGGGLGPMLQEGLGRGEVRVHRIVDVGQADFHRCLLGPNGNQFAAARFFNQAWNQVRVPGAKH